MIRKLERKDKENWIRLYCGYAKFYKVSINNEILNTLWSWIHDKNNVLNGIWGDFNYSKMDNFDSWTYCHTFWMISGTSKKSTGPSDPVFITKIYKKYI